MRGRRAEAGIIKEEGRQERNENSDTSSDD
jgi:hypothetical protein